MPTRHAHLVGSLPGPTPGAAMATALELVGPYLRSLPDGETGERRNWIISIVESLRAHPDLQLTRSGDWSDYDKLPRFKVKSGHRLYGAGLDLGHVAAVRESFPVFEEARSAAGLEHLGFQQGIPSDFDLAMFTLGPAGALWHRRAFTEALLAEVRDIRAITGPTTLFQIEIPAELVAVARAPSVLRRGLARLLARGVTALAGGAPLGTRFAVHLCLGDMNNRAFGTMDDAGPLVELANILMATWPAERPLELVHAPFAAADQPATTDPGFYAPLKDLAIPAQVHVAAGFAHESQSLEEQRRIRTIIEDHLGRPVTIAAACGLGRRSEEAGRAVLERMASLCED